MAARHLDAGLAPSGRHAGLCERDTQRTLVSRSHPPHSLSSKSNPCNRNHLVYSGLQLSFLCLPAGGTISICAPSNRSPRTATPKLPTVQTPWTPSTTARTLPSGFCLARVVPRTGRGAQMTLVSARQTGGASAPCAVGAH